MVEGWAPVIREYRLIPSKGGIFEVILDGELIFSKKELKRHADDGEVMKLIEARLGPVIPRD